MTHAHDPGPVGHPSTETFWNDHYGQRDQIWSGRPNAVLVDEVSGLEPGRALDVGCGEGADAIWLAGRGWRVTAVDVSGLALDRARAAAAEAGVAAASVAPGGRLLVVGHSGLPSWVQDDQPDVHFVTPGDVLESLALDPELWETLACEVRTRAVTAPDGSDATLDDGVVLVRRRELSGS